MNNLIISACLIFSTIAHATVHVVAYDPTTGSMGLAVSSSGPAYIDAKTFNVRRHGIGIVGAGGAGLCGKAKANELLSRQLSASEIVTAISSRCNHARPYFRLAIVTADGDVRVHRGPQGCNSNNSNCGAIQGQHFGIIGGGLRAGVLQAGFDHFHSLSTQIPLECRLLSTLSAIHRAGGEFKNFKVSNISMSIPGRSATLAWQSKGAEGGQIASLRSSLRRSGFSCSN